MGGQKSLKIANGIYERPLRQEAIEVPSKANQLTFMSVIFPGHEKKVNVVAQKLA